MHGGRLLVSLVAAASLPLIAAPLPAQAGQLDPVFGAGGIARVDAALPPMDRVNATSRSSDFVNVAGRAGDRFAVGRAASDPFGAAGPVRLTTVDFGVPSEAFGLMPGADGVLAVGTAGGDFALATLSDKLDAHLGYPDQGRIRTSFGAEAVANAVASDARGVVSVGSVNAGQGSSLAIARYDVDRNGPGGFPYGVRRLGPNGPDLSFDQGGKVIDDITPGDDVAYAVLPENLVAGKAGGSALLASYRADGTPNPFFGSGGRALLDLSAGDDVAYAVIRDTSTATQRIFIAGAAGSDAFVAGLFTDGRPDPAFGTNGVLRMSLGGPSRFTAMAIGDTAESLILSGVVTRAGGDDAVLARVTKDGTLDSTFGVAGVVVADLGGPADRVAGTTVGWSSKTNFVRYFDLAGGDGKDGLVVTFDGSGRRVGTKRLGFGVPTDDWVLGSHRFADGKTLVHGVRSFAGPFLARLLADGSPDPSFGRAGFLDPALGANVVPRALAIAGDGGIIALFDVFTDRHVYFVARFFPDGRRDLSFGPQGVASLGTAEAETYGVVPLTDGRVMVSVGDRTFPLSTTGQRDMSWGGGLGVVSMNVLLPEADGNVLAFRGDANGMAGTCLGIRAERYRPDGTHAIAWCAGPSFDPTTVLRRPDGRIIVAGRSGLAYDRAWIASFLPSGVVDPAFGTHGYVRPDAVAGGPRVLIAFGPAGTLVFASPEFHQQSHVALGRLLADGRVDRSFGPGGIAKLTATQSPEALAVQPDGKVVITGTVGVEGSHDVALIRFTPSGQPVVVPKTLGWNGVGMLGTGTRTDSRTPVAPLGLSNVREVSAGWYHSLAVLDDGSVWAWGWNALGQLGTGSTTDAVAPVRVTGLPRIIGVAAGEFHSMALGADGSVWAWGWNGVGQLGLGTIDNHYRPMRVPIDRVTSIAAGAVHSVALRADGVVWSWGWNAVGQLGIGTTTDSLWPSPHTNTDRLVKIAAGAFHTLGLSSAGHVYAWGWNIFGQLGLGEAGDVSIPTVVPGIRNAVDIAGGGHHSLAVTTNVPGGVDGGTVWAWGWNGVGQLGDGTTTTRFAPVAVPGLAGIRDVAAGVFHSLALGPGGALWTWGWNAGGQQGDGTLTDRHSPWRATTIVDGTTISGGVLHTMMG